MTRPARSPEHAPGDHDSDDDDNDPGEHDSDVVPALEAERDFLLRSIDDLDAEAAAGNLDATQHQALRDDYTARAAAVLRSIDEGVDERAVAPARSVRHRVLVGVGLVAFAGAAGLLLSQTLGDRLPGQSATGNAQSGPAQSGPATEPGPDQQRATFEAAVAANPDDAEAHLNLARFLWNVEKPVDALKAYDQAARLDPGDPEARAYAGWVLYLVAQQEGVPAEKEASLVDGSLRRLDEAVAVDPSYPDAHFFRATVLLRARNDPPGAVAAYERYLELAPDGVFNAQVRQLLDEARKQAG